MDEEKLRKILEKNNQDISRYEKLLDLYLKQEYFSNRNITIFSIALSGFLTYRFWKNKIIFRENHGHFNSPQNLLNKSLTKNYILDGIFRFFVGGLSFYFALNTFKSIYFKLDSRKDETEEQINQLDDKDIHLIKSFSYDSEKILKIGIDDINDKINPNFVQKIFTIDKKLEERDNLQRYYDRNNEK
jgi:hypothetical protein